MSVNEPLAFGVADPCAGPLTRSAVRLSPLASVSWASTPGADLMSGLFLVAASLSLASAGASLTGLTVLVIVAALLSGWPPFALSVNESAPLKFGAGVDENVPFGFGVSVPWLGPLTRVAGRASPSPSSSFARTPPGFLLRTARAKGFVSGGDGGLRFRMAQTMGTAAGSFAGNKAAGGSLGSRDRWHTVGGGNGISTVRR